MTVAPSRGLVAPPRGLVASPREQTLSSPQYGVSRHVSVCSREGREGRNENEAQ